MKRQPLAEPDQKPIRRSGSMAKIQHRARTFFGDLSDGLAAPRMDPVLFFALVLLVAFGITMMYSASAIYADVKNGDSLYFFKRQLLSLAIGILGIALVTRLGYQRLVAFAYPLLGLTILLLILVLIPGVGSKVGGSWRWIRLGSFGIQPAELAKIVFIIYLAFSLTKKKESIKAFRVGFLPHLLVSGVFILLLLKQPDFGTAATLAILLFLMLFVAGARMSYISISALAAVPMAYGLITGSPYRLRRFMAFLDPWSHRFDVGYQISESLMSFGSGGVGGVGLGEGKHKLGFLPAGHTDFIFSTIGEELGLIGVGLVILLFGILVWRGFRAALRAPDLFGTYLAFGITILIGLQALFNMGVVTGLLPTKGLTLPFFSYGGSSMIFMLVATGILLSVSAAGEQKSKEDAKVTWP